MTDPNGEHVPPSEREPRCPRCKSRMAGGAQSNHLTCRNIGCPCFITVDDGVVHYGPPQEVPHA
jgi:hypothetical protein